MRLHWPLTTATTVAGCSLLCGCLNPNTYTTPRTLNPGDVQFQVAPEFYGGSFTQTVPRPNGIGVTTQTTSFGVPTLPSFGVRYGLADGFELGGRVPNLTSLAFDGKIRLLKSRLDLAVDPGLQAQYFSEGSTTDASGQTVTQSTAVFSFHLPVLLGINLSDKFSIVLSPGVAYALATTSITTGDTYAQATGSTGLMVRGSLGVEYRFSKKFALHPEGTVLRGFGDTEPLLYLIGIGINFGAMPDYSDLAETTAAPAPAPKGKPEEGGT
jgi:hypothetical protein